MAAMVILILVSTLLANFALLASAVLLIVGLLGWAGVLASAPASALPMAGAALGVAVVFGIVAAVAGRRLASAKSRAFQAKWGLDV